MSAPAEWYRVAPELYVAVPLKCGSTAFRAVVSGHYSTGAIKTQTGFNRYMHARGRGPFRPAQVATWRGRRVLAVRDPVERFLSLWRSIASVSAQGRSTSLTGGHGLMHATPDTLMAYIEAHPGADLHWKRQSDYLPAGAPVELVPYRELLERLGLDSPEWNPSRAEFVCEPPVERIRAHYARDHELAGLARDAAEANLEYRLWPRG